MELRRLRTLRNNTTKILYLREVQSYAVEGSYGHVTVLEAYSARHDFPATRYTGRNRDSSRGSKIIVFLGKDEALVTLAPEKFVQYVELIFEMDEGTNQLIVYGIPARFMDDIRQLWAFGFPVRNYRDRSRYEIVMRCGFKVVETEK